MASKISSSHKPFQIPTSFRCLSALILPAPLPPLYALIKAPFFQASLDKSWEAVKTDALLTPREKNFMERHYLYAKADLNGHMYLTFAVHAIIHTTLAISLLAAQVFSTSLIFIGAAALYARSAWNRDVAQQPLKDRLIAVWKEFIEMVPSEEARKERMALANESLVFYFGKRAFSAFTPA